MRFPSFMTARDFLRRCLPASLLLLALTPGPSEADDTPEVAPLPEAPLSPYGPLLRGSRDSDSLPEPSTAPLRRYDGRQEKLAIPAPAPLFKGPGALLPPQKIPEGLNTLSAQECGACHTSAHSQWAESGHGNAWNTQAYQDALKAAGSPPACVQCHTPLMEQQAQRVTSYVQRDPARPVVEANPSYSPLLQGEGVTCAACHVRDGIVYGRRQLPEGRAPHPIQANPDLARPEFCASCHQMALPGAESSPFYDTYGEWKESKWAEAGIGCVDCHMPYGEPRATLGGTSTRPRPHHGGVGRGLQPMAPPLTVTLAPGKATYAPGEIAEIAVTLFNTGAGHALPSGAPFRAIRGWIEVEGGEALEVVHLTRQMSPEPPHREVKDTRLQAGESMTVTVRLRVPKGSPAGPLPGTITFDYVPTNGQDPEDDSSQERAPMYQSTWSLPIR